MPARYLGASLLHLPDESGNHNKYVVAPFMELQAIKKERNLELPDEQEIFEAYLDKAAFEASSLRTQIRTCKACDLHGAGKKPLPGGGYPLADLFLLKGQAGEFESAEGTAFAGETMEALRKAFDKLDLEASHIYGTNAVKCYRKGRRATENHVKACLSHLRLEIAICEPRIILAMGPIACHALMALGDSLEQIEFRPGSVFGMMPDLQVVVTSDFEKALNDVDSKRRFWKDLQLTKEIVDKRIAREQEN